MAFVEYLRVRRALVVFAVVLGLMVAVTAISIAVGFRNAGHDATVSSGASGVHITVNSGDVPGRSATMPIPHSLADLPFTIPIGFVFAIAGFCAIVMATILGASLNKEGGRGGFAFTKPISRERLALTYFGIDFVGIALVYAYTVVLGLAAFAILGILGKVVVDGGASSIAIAGLGAAAMWYGLLQAATAFRADGGGLLIGLSWPIFTIVAGLFAVTAFGPVFHGIIAALDFFDPLAYYEITSHNEHVAVSSLFGFAPAVAASITWCVALAACTAAVFGLKRLDT